MWTLWESDRKVKEMKEEKWVGFGFVLMCGISECVKKKKKKMEDGGVFGMLKI